MSKYIAAYSERTTKGDWLTLARMYRVLGFLCLLIHLLATAGGPELKVMSILFAAQSAFFFLLGFMNLSERTYMYVFGGYMLAAFISLNYWMFFQMAPQG